MNDILLLSMMLGSPKYGYQLKREAGLTMGQALHNNLVYPSLRRFLEEGWVSKKAVPGERGQTRQQYVLSAEGRRRLFERLNQFSEADAPEEAAFHLRVGLFPALKRETRENILARREAWLQARDKNLATLEANLELGPSECRDGHGSPALLESSIESPWIHGGAGLNGVREAPVS